MLKESVNTTQPMSQGPQGLGGADLSGQRSKPRELGADLPPPWYSGDAVCVASACGPGCLLCLQPLTSKVYPGVFTEPVTITPGSTPMVSIAPSVGQVELSSPSALEPP